MARPLKFRDFRKIMKRFDVGLRQSRRKPTHWMLVRDIEGVRYCYPIAVHDGEVKGAYVSKTRRHFKLRPEDGVTDEEFYGKQPIASRAFPRQSRTPAGARREAPCA